MQFFILKLGLQIIEAYEVHVLAFLWGLGDGYYVTYKPITLSCTLFMFIKMKFIHCHSCMIFVMKFMRISND